MNLTQPPYDDPTLPEAPDEMPAPGSETVQKSKLGRKQVLLLFGGFAFLLGLAIFGFLGGFITSDDSPKTGQMSDGGASSLAPPEARPHGLDAREKYDKYGYDGASLNPTTSAAIDRQAAAGTQLLTGKDPSVARGSNELLTDGDLVAIGSQSARTTTPYQSATERKAARQNQLKRQFNHQQAERDAIYRTIHRSPKGREQLTEERIARRERDLDRQTADALLRQMETANQRLGTGPATQKSPTMDTSLNMTEYEQLKALHNGVLPPSYRPYFKREIDHENAATGESGEKGPVNIRTIGFYGLTGQPGNASASTPARSGSIPAVIHGDGDAVTVQNASTIKIRLLEETSLRLSGQLVKLPAYTLLAGTCSVGSDRLNIVVTSLRLGNDIHAVRLTAYDLDGRAGLSVPKLSDKNRLAQSTASSAGQAISSPYYFVPQGSFGQQMGSQLAMQVTNTAFQGIRSLVQTKLSAVKVTVKPNYRIFLRSDQQGNQLDN